MKSKGQMFLIGAAVIVAALVIIRANMAGSLAAYEIEKLETTLENSIFENILNEMNKTMILSSDNPQQIDNNIFDFMNFTESKIYGHSMTLKILYVGIISNKTISRMNVSLINSIDSTIDANFSIPGQSSVKSGIVNYEKWDSNFTIIPSTNYDLILTYNATTNDNSTSVTENITVSTKSSRDVYVGFLYIVLESEDAIHAEKYQKPINMNK
jgi:hypothetical protein